MPRTSVEIELVALVNDANKTVKKFASDTQKELSKINLAGTFTAISAGFLAAKAGFDSVSAVLSNSFNVALEAQQAINNLNNSLRISGEFSEVATEGVIDYAKALEQVTKFTKEQIINSFALSKNFGLVNAESKEVVKVATDLAAITGQDLNSAVEQLAQTYNGFLNKQLVRIRPELKLLTREQLAAGEATRLLGEFVKGSASRELQGFSGELIRARKDVNDFSESLGGILVRGASFGIKALRGLIDISKEFALTLERDSLSARAYAERYGTIFDQVSKTIKKVNSQNEQDILDQQTKRKAELERIRAFKAEELKILLEAKKAQEKARFESTLQETSLLGLTEEQKLVEQFAQKREALEIGIQRNLFKNRAEQEKAFTALAIEESNRLAKLRKDTLAKEIQAPIETLVQAKFQLSNDSKAAIGIGITQSILKGAEGARQLVASAAGAAADVILPGAGAAVSQIVTELSKGKEYVRQQVQEFAKALPLIIETIIEALPVLTETLARELPPALAKTFPFLAQRFAIEIVKNMPAIIKGFAQGLVEAAKEFVKTLLDTLKSAGGILDPISGKNSGGVFEGIPVLGGIGDLFGFAEGGRVPNDLRFKGDNFPARLDAGEQIFSADLSDKLDQFLSAEQTGRPLVVNLVVGQQQLAKAILDLNRGGFRTA